jgi:hypothetical protein
VLKEAHCFIFQEKAMLFHRPFLVLAACFALLLSASVASADDGTISGKITLKGQPLESGRVFFHLDDGQFVGATVKDGVYKVSRVPEGPRKITVEGKGVPAKYASEATSGLTVTIAPGAQTYDLDLK